MQKPFTLYKNACIRFKNFKRLLKALFLINAEFEIMLSPETDNKIEDPNTSYTQKYQDHIFSS